MRRKVYKNCVGFRCGLYFLLPTEGCLYSGTGEVRWDLNWSDKARAWDWAVEGKGGAASFREERDRGGREDGGKGRWARPTQPGEASSSQGFHRWAISGVGHICLIYVCSLYLHQLSLCSFAWAFWGRRFTVINLSGILQVYIAFYGAKAICMISNWLSGG